MDAVELNGANKDSALGFDDVQSVHAITEEEKIYDAGMWRK